jgi:hypothetical protein
MLADLAGFVFPNYAFTTDRHSKCFLCSRLPISLKEFLFAPFIFLFRRFESKWLFLHLQSKTQFIEVVGKAV